LLRRIFPSGTWGRSSKPSTAVKAGNLRNQVLAVGLYWTANAVGMELKLECTEAFFLSTLCFLPLKLSPLQI
jgi:hypothetical protein